MRARARKKFQWVLPRGRLVLGERTLVMGVLNVTPDSFSDGGRYLSPKAAVKQALAMQRAGADLLDIGGESTRPGSEGVSAEEELRRILPVLRGLRGRTKIPISVDTNKAGVAEVALEAGAQIINDITGLRADPEIASVVKRAKAGLILMHIRGMPRTMQKKQFARNVWRMLERDLRKSIELALQRGVRRSQLVLDPGIGFGKSTGQNCEIIKHLRRLEQFRLPVLIGTSRKTFIGKILDDSPPAERLWGTAASVTAAILGGAHIVRVHDVEEMWQVVRISDAILKS